MMHQGSTAIAGKTAITAKAVGGDPMSVMFNAGELEISAVLSDAESVERLIKVLEANKSLLSGKADKDEAAN